MRRLFMRFTIICFFVSMIIPAMGYRDKGYLYLSPVPDAEYVAPETEFILIRFSEIQPSNVTNLSSFVQLTGASSGSHTGTTKVASDGRTVIFEVSSVFIQNELVTVSLNPIVAPGAGATVDPYVYQFMISKPMPDSSATSAQASVDSPQNSASDSESVSEPQTNNPSTSSAGMSLDAVITSNGVSVPSDFPDITITANNDPAPGYIYIDYSGTPKYTMMLDSSGAPVWYRRGESHRDFKLQKNGILTWTAFEGYDQNFNRLASPADSYHAVNGYSTDDHELQVLEDGNYLLIGKRNEIVDMSRYVSGGRTSATVRETVLQEFTSENDLIFQWRAWDNHDIRLMEYWSYDDKPTSNSIRFPHMNAIDVDNDGHLLVSNKRLSEVTKINRHTGEVIWRLGSGNPVNPNDDPYRDERLTIVNDPLGQFNVQHDIRVVGENRYTLFDNHHLDNNPNSRAVEYEIDPNNRTASLVWQYAGGYDSYHMGSAQRLSNGNTLINWVITGAPKVTEVRPDGTKAFEMNWTAGNSKSYRVFKFPWDGMVEVPNLIIEQDSDHVLLLFNKFGDPNVARYNIYGGTSPEPTEILATSTTAMKRLDNLRSGNQYYFRVTAVDMNDGTESDFSEEKSIYVDILVPGKNLVMNGDFSDGKNDWIWEVTDTAQAEWFIENGISQHAISQPGTQIHNVQMRQAGIPLYQGKEYVLAFDAWSDLPRQIEFKVGQDESPFTNYSGISTTPITPNRTRYHYTFTMNDSTDLSARVVLNTGTSTYDVDVDDIVVFAVAPGDFDKDGTVKLNDFAVLASQWQQTGSGLTADLHEDNNVNMDDLLIFVSNWSLSLDFPMAAPGDFNKDGAVNLNDFAVIASQWQMTGSGLTADLNGNDSVDMDDLLIFIGNWSLE